MGNVEVHVGHAFGKALQNLVKPRDGGEVSASYAERPCEAGVLVAGPGDGPVEAREDVVAVCGKELAGGGELHAAPRAVHQAHTHLVFEPGDLL